MGGERKCILCDIVYSSRQEMDEHMRSMLHHRELENLKGRDCGHKCWACGVSVVGLTEYASHISSPVHKQRVEAQQLQRAAGDPEEEYFDTELVRLIEKRKETIRKEEEAAKKAKEESERQKQQQEKQRFLQRGPLWDSGYRRFPAASNSYRTSNWPGSRAGWGSAGVCQGWPRNWLPSHQPRSATWHAGGHSSFHGWNPLDPSGSSMRSGRPMGGKNQGYQGFQPHERGFDWQQTRNRLFKAVESHLNADLRSDNFPLLGIIRYNKEPVGQKERHQEWAERFQDSEGEHQKKGCVAGDPSKGKSSKPCGSNPKEKVNRWTPYPAAKCSDLPWKETDVSLPESCPVTAVKDVMPNINLKKNTTHTDQILTKDLKEKHPSSSNLQPEQVMDRRHLKNSNSQRDYVAPSPAGINVEKISGDSSTSRSHHRTTTRGYKEPKSTIDSSGSLQDHGSNHEGQRLKEVMGKATVSVNTSTADYGVEPLQQHMEEIREVQEAESTECQAAKAREEMVKKQIRLMPVNKNLDGAGHDSYTKDAPRHVSIQTDGPSSTHSSSLQSVQVSTSTCDTTGDAALLVRHGEKQAEREVEEETGGEDVQSDSAKKAQSDVKKGLGSDTEDQSGGQSQTRSESEVPGLGKLGLPASLKRDLTRHIGHKNKAGVREPNLNIARRIRNVSGTRRSEVERDAGLKPSLRQLISCPASRRNVNWDQVYQEVSKKKQELGKGMPRFGIEMVAHDQRDQEELNREDDSTWAEGFCWESLCKSTTAFSRPSPCKRSSSEGSMAADCMSTGLSAVMTAPYGGDGPELHPPGDHSSTADGHLFPMSEKADIKAEAAEDEEKTELVETPKFVQDPDSVEGYSSCTSGTEQNDTQSTGKKRRAAGDVPSPEVTSLELKNKRRKIKSRKERTHVDQLLAVSLREEELNTSLEAVDKSLTQARATLEVAYMEVQRLLVLKQQVTMEMSTLRSKRIEILQGFQGDYTAESGEKGKTDNAASATVASAPPSFSSITTMASYFPSFPSPAIPTQFLQQQVPNTSLSLTHPTPGTTVPLPIKQEALPSRSLHSNASGASTTMKALHSTSSDPNQSSPSINRLGSEGKSELVQGSFVSKDSMVVPSEHSQEGLQDGSSVGAHQSLAGVHWEKSGALTSLQKIGTRPRGSTTSASQRSSSTVATDCTDLLEDLSSVRTWYQSSTHPEIQVSPSSVLPESKNGKRVRKLKKKKSLRRVPGDEQLGNSDTEQEEDAFRPVRKLKSRKRPKVSPGSTSLSFVKREEEEAEADGKMVSLSTTDQNKKAGGHGVDSEMVELPQAKPHRAFSISPLGPEDALISPSSAGKKVQGTKQPSVAAKSESQTLACNEVTSTSELDGSTTVKVHNSKNQQPLTSGKVFRSGSDMSLELGDEEEPTEGSFEGHQAAISSMQIDGGLLYTCSGDRTVRAFDLASRRCVAVFEGHATKVNCLLVSSGVGLQHRLYTGSSDQTMRCYNPKTQECQEQFSMADRVLCFHSRWKVLYAGLANGSVVSLSLKTNQLLDVFECHGPRAISCLASAQEGARRILLVGSYDCTVSVRDARSGLLLRTLEGHTKIVLCIKVVNDLVFSGSSDQLVHAYNIHTGELVRVYKGHSHAVTVVTILGKVMVTACLDKLVRIFDLQSHEQLQVYGGHRDMVTCMVVHKNMIYTGCYDGSVQAVRLNLIKNHRCWWHGCSMVFGVMEHLQQHLLGNHSSNSFQTLKCRWKKCDTTFSVRNNTKQDVPRHMQKHAEEDSKLHT
ncbi:zinc finger protein 106 isoform X1 [Arapaima gigas]